MNATSAWRTDMFAPKRYRRKFWDQWQSYMRLSSTNFDSYHSIDLLESSMHRYHNKSFHLLHLHSSPRRLHCLFSSSSNFWPCRIQQQPGEQYCQHLPLSPDIRSASELASNSRQAMIPVMLTSFTADPMKAFWPFDNQIFTSTIACP